MESEFELTEALERLLRSHCRGFIVVDGVIDAVNDDNTCDVMVGTTLFNSVPLKVLIKAQASVYEIPVVKSACLMGFRDGNINRPQIISVDQVDELLINCKTLVKFNGGQLGGMVKLNDVVTKLNNLEEDINKLKTAFESWTPVPNDGGSALKAASGTWAGENLTLTVKADLENTEIQQ